jgi:acyl-CoA synthetase (AMP-forming)/AMP-acid ligase II
MECRVVDPVTGVDLPPDSQGELLFRGSNCFSGYLNDPELTAQVSGAVADRYWMALDPSPVSPSAGLRGHFAEGRAAPFPAGQAPCT